MNIYYYYYYYTYTHTHIYIYIYIYIYMLYSNYYKGINTDLVPQLFRKVQSGTRTLRMFNLVPKLFKRIYFGTFR